MSNEKVRIKLLSGCNVDLSVRVHDECYCNFDEFKYGCFSNIINGGLYFPQIVQFIYVMTSIFKGHTSFEDIFLVNILSGVCYTLVWFWLKLYKLPGVSFISCFIGGNIFRLFLHFIVIAVVALFVVGDWKLILYCLVGGLVTSIVKSFLFARLSTVKYNDQAAIYVSNFKSP